MDDQVRLRVRLGKNRVRLGEGNGEQHREEGDEYGNGPVAIWTIFLFFFFFFSIPSLIITIIIIIKKNAFISDIYTYVRICISSVYSSSILLAMLLLCINQRSEFRNQEPEVKYQKSRITSTSASLYPSASSSHQIRFPFINKTFWLFVGEGQ